MGENPQRVQNLDNEFSAQPQDVTDAVQRLRLLAQQTGSLKSTQPQTVTRVPKSSTSSAVTTTITTSASTPTASSTVIKIGPINPQVVYVPNYTPVTVYGAWPNTAYPPVYLPPPGQQFADSFVKGFGYSLGVTTTYALFSSIDWDDDNHHYHDDDRHHDDDYHHSGNSYQHNSDNININVNNFNRISEQNLPAKRWAGSIIPPSAMAFLTRIIPLLNDSIPPTLEAG